MRVLAINFGDETCASSYYRVWQFQRALRDLGIELEGVAARDFLAKSSETGSRWRLEDYQVVLVQKRLFPAGTVRMIRSKAKRLVYDLDDALWAPQGKEHHWITQWRTNHRLQAITRAADVCLVANEVIEAELKSRGARTTLFPMALDGSIWRPGAGTARETVRVGWSGGRVNLRYLEEIEPALAAIQAELPQVEFVVHCGKQPAFISGLRYTHAPYVAGGEPGVVQNFDIGLAPLPNDAFAAGKSPVKCIQYMASGAAAIVSPVGATRSMFSDHQSGIFARSLEDWQRAIHLLATDPKIRMQIAAKARAEFEAKYALSGRAVMLAEVLRG